MKINIIKIKKYKKIPISHKFKKCIQTIIKKNIHLNIKITNQYNIKLLNLRYRKINKTTDILSFKTEKKIKKILGDIIICYSFVSKKDINTWYKITIHGILHLLEYNHENTKDNQIMTQLEIKIGMSGIEPPTTTTSK